ncbi:MAG: NAD-dependent epimerase/dehydratase family protein [Acidobacteria bacterium]|nr:NAD-dependent epimerase/dehydratase family protein [Acidobacteriota bacterium]
MRYKNRRVLVTGGLGFIGSNLALQLAAEGARVTVVDPCVPGCGGDPAHIPSSSGIYVIAANIGQVERLRDHVMAADVVFNIAGEISHIQSMLNPERDLDLNTRDHLRFLEACREWRRGVRVVYASTRQVFGVPEYLPVDEHHPVNPVDYNGVHKYAASQYHLMLSRKGDLDAIVLRLTNVYGPRMSFTAMNQGFLSVFLKRMSEGRPLAVYGDGEQLRDPLYISDCVEAFLRAGLMESSVRAFNVGGGEVLSLRQIAGISAEVAGLPEPQLVPFPSERQAIDIGSYYTDSTLFRTTTGWAPQVNMEQGMREALAYYVRHQSAASVAR